MTRREELLLCKDKYESARRRAADEAHENRVLREAAENDLRELEKQETKAAKASPAAAGLDELAREYEAEKASGLAP